jgi:alginate O-acetyltransferase complex protein AlgF
MRTTTALLTAALLAALALPAQAGDEGVYGPVAPPNSAFVRVFNATAQPELQARIADKTLEEIPAFGASEFVFLPPGKYTLTVGAVSQPVTLQANKFYTAALEGKELRMLENERYTNRLKALVMVYNLVDGSTLSLKTPDGRPVVENVAANSTGSREVNAVKVSLAVFDGTKKITDVKPMNLERGRAFSLFIAGDKDQPVTSWVVN